MAIPKSVSHGLTSGVVGEISHAGPIRAVAAILSSADEKQNIFGRAYTYKDDSVESVQVGGKGAFAGIMINPKAYRIEVNYARNGTQGEFLTMGEVYVELSDDEGKINDPVVFSETDGSLSATPRGRVTEISDEQYAQLKDNHVFQLHKENGFISVENRKEDPEKVATNMEASDKSAPDTVESLEAEKQAVPKTNKKGK